MLVILITLLLIIFPAVSPRIYLQSYYKNEINGFFITTWFILSKKKVPAKAATNSYGAFPLSILSGVSCALFHYYSTVYCFYNMCLIIYRLMITFFFAAINDKFSYDSIKISLFCMIF